MCAQNDANQANDLAAFVSHMGGERALRVEESFGKGYVRLRVPEAERRQAKHDIRCVEDVVVELLRNSRDAQARRMYVATTRVGNLRTITVLDDGCGIPQNMHGHIFEARVTSKLESMRMDRWGVHGRGMALYSIYENAKQALVMSSAEGLGTSIYVALDVSTIKERSDQSTWPSFGFDEEGNRTLAKGPHNIVRSCCEFALEERGICEVYLGSPAEIVATARKREGRADLLAINLLHKELDELPVLERLAYAVDAKELWEVSQGLGLDISERTAHRIIAGDIKAQTSVLTTLERLRSRTKAHKEVDLERDRRSLKIDSADLEAFSAALERAFVDFGDTYYLSLSNAPRVRVTPGHIVVSFDVHESD